MGKSSFFRKQYIGKTLKASFTTSQGRLLQLAFFFFLCVGTSHRDNRRRFPGRGREDAGEAVFVLVKDADSEGSAEQ